MKCRRPIHIKLRQTGIPELDLKTSLTSAVAGDIALVPCGQCLHCRINQSRVWTNRILLEQTQWEDSVFLTLTYDDQHLPNPPSVNKRHMQNFMKRLRRNLNKPIKYFTVGEYGDDTYRPHYHSVIFGLNWFDSEPVKKSWQYCDPDIGISMGELNPSSARYITGYITKKILKRSKRHPSDKGLNDEFMLSSRRGGGIGKAAAISILEVKKKFPEVNCDNTTCLRVGPKLYPLGRYLKQFANEKMTWENQLLRFATSQQSQVDQNRKGEVRRKKINSRGRYL